MDKERLEFYLNRGTSFGYNTKNDADTIAWVILSKRFPIERFFERFNREDNEVIFEEQTRIKQYPYNVWIAELNKEVYKSETFPENVDYLVSETYCFSSLAEVEVFYCLLASA